MVNTTPTAPPARVSPTRTTTVSVLVSVAGSLLGTWVTGQLDSSPEFQLAGAVLGALVPAVLGELLKGADTNPLVAVAVALVAIALTYVSFTAAAYVTESPSRFPLPPGAPSPTGTITDSDGGLAIAITPARLECTADGCREQVRIENAGDLPLRVDAIEVEGIDAGSFEPDPAGTCAYRMLPESGDSCSFDVRFTPSGDGGTATATLVIHRNLPEVPSYVPLVGENGDGGGDGEVLDVVGEEQNAARQALAAEGFTNITVQAVDSDEPAGEVIATEPEAGTRVALGDEIVLQVSSGPVGPVLATIPSVDGMSAEAALDALASRGFTNVSVVDAAGEEVDTGGATAVRTSPPAGSQVAPGEPILLEVEVEVEVEVGVEDSAQGPLGSETGD